MKLSQVNLTGAKRTTSVEVNEALFGPINPELLSQAVYIYRSNQRQGGAKVQTRSEVSRTKTKWYKQKGTGRARHGARTSNIFIGGGVVFGPTGQENFTKKLSQKMKSAALRSALGITASYDNVMLADGLKGFTGKTKEAQDAYVRISEDRTDRVLFIIAGDYAQFRLAAANLPEVELTRADRVNAYEVASADKVVIFKEALEVLEQRLLNSTDKSAKTTAVEPTAKKTAEKPAAKTSAKPAAKSATKTADKSEETKKSAKPATKAVKKTTKSKASASAKKSVKTEKEVSA